MRMKASAALVGLAVAGVSMFATSSASSHGYTDNPISRQKLCANGTVTGCGNIQWEPQSVEGPKGLMSCSGGNAQFAELDNDNKGWKATSVGSSTDFSWTLTARHATSTWQYYIGNSKIAEFNDNGAQPGATVTHQVDFGNLSGKQKVLAVWNIADTANAFYACIDVNVS